MFYLYISDKISKIFSDQNLKPTITTPTITFMIPYIKFVNYSQDYNWYWELIRPKSSSFVKTIGKDIYKTWEGEALINFKWNTYGKYYYAIIWIGFIALLGCFTVAAMPEQYFDNEDVRKQLLIASIILAFIHLSFEVRQLIYNPIKWIHDIWNLFGMYLIKSNLIVLYYFKKNIINYVICLHYRSNCIYTSNFHFHLLASNG